ncbi:MAG: DoxX family protein, partial [Phycisphaeraceae bacterium]|nr:DoxX family protein [Phycisphaeraceae bacterium]
MQANRQDLHTSIGLLILRVGLGGYMLTHGFSKLQKVLDGQFDKFADPIGIGSGPSLVMITFAEFGCALLVMAGLATRLAAIPLVIGMAVAALVFHADDPWTMAQASNGSKEPALMYLFAFATLIFTGAGQFSLDRMA